MTRIYGAAGEDGRRLAYPLLALAAADAWGWESLPPIGRSPRGRPFFPDRGDRWFSLSHSGGLALCALSDGGPVGVDIERVIPRRSWLPSRCLSERELASFDGSWEAFYRLWTLKESWCKREDTPLWPPREVDTPPPCPHRSYGEEGWAAAVCCSDQPPADILWLKGILTKA